MQAIEDYKVFFDQVVAWGDMDAFGHVNNVMFYRYIESARIHYMGLIGAFDGGDVCVVATSSCKFLAPIHFPDTLRIGVRVSQVRTSGFMMEYALYSTMQNKVVAVADAVMVLMNQAVTSKAIISANARAKINALEGQAF